MGPDTDELEPVNWPSHEGRLPGPRHRAAEPAGSAAPRDPAGPTEPADAADTTDFAEPAGAAEPVDSPEPVDSAEPASAGSGDDGAGKRPRRWWRGLTGSLAAGMVVLAVVVLGAGVLAYFGPTEGPGLPSLVAHPVAAVAALGAQRVIDRKSGAAAGAAAAALLAVVAGTLVFFWWF